MTRYRTKVTLPKHPRELPEWICAVLESGKDVKITLNSDGQVVCQSEPRASTEEDEKAKAR